MSTPDEPTPSADTSTHTLFAPPEWSSEASTASPISHFSSLDPELLARSPWPAGFVFLDEFEVEGVLGQGGMGIVYRVSQQATGQRLAVKRARLTHASIRRRFLAELQLWMDLPDHPHLAPCRFFRTVEDEVVIFSDLATGGSLADWIVHRRLARLADILDIAIQVARGLHALHERGLVHQDVKPANVLMSSDGLARVADFGLARARARLHQATAQPDGQSVVFSSGAMTPAYCSPEQAQRQPVSRRTDVWSWGVLVLEMFVGKVPCCDRGGQGAVEILEEYLDTPTGAELPSSVQAVLQLCFQSLPTQRWSSLAEAADELARVYRSCLGASYPRVAPALETELLPLERQAGMGRWDPPGKWLALAFQAAGRDPTEADSALPPPAATRRAQAVADLSAYEEALRLFDRLITAGREDLRPQVAALTTQKALVHAWVGDWPGARDCFGRALAAWEELVQHRGRRELTPWLVRACLLEAQALRGLGEHVEALSRCDRVVTLFNRLDNRRRRREMRADLAAAYLEKGLVLRDRGGRRASVSLFERAITLLREVVGQEGNAGATNDLAHACLALAGVLSGLGRFREALELCDQALALRRRLVQKDGRRHLEGDLARAYLTRANVLRAQDNPRASIGVYEQAISLFEHLIEDDDRDDLAGELARACIAHAHAVSVLGEPGRAAELCGRATEILERLLQQEGRSDLQHELARAYLQQGNALRFANRPGLALGKCEQAVLVWERLVVREGRADLTNDLARAFVAKAGVLRLLGQGRQALDLYDRAIALRESLLERGEREDLPVDIARDRVGRAELLAEAGELERAKHEVRGARTCLEEEYRQTRRGDLKGMLSRARKLQQKLGEGEDAG